MASSEGKAAPKSSRHKTGANLLPEALAVDLHVLEDEDMIRSLGRPKFVELCIHGSQAWQEGVSAFTYIPFFFLVFFSFFWVYKIAYRTVFRLLLLRNWTIISAWKCHCAQHLRVVVVVVANFLGAQLPMDSHPQSHTHTPPVLHLAHVTQFCMRVVASTLPSLSYLGMCWQTV